MQVEDTVECPEMFVDWLKKNRKEKKFTAVQLLFCLLHERQWRPRRKQLHTSPIRISLNNIVSDFIFLISLWSKWDVIQYCYPDLEDYTSWPRLHSHTFPKWAWVPGLWVSHSFTGKELWSTALTLLPWSKTILLTLFFSVRFLPLFYGYSFISSLFPFGLFFYVMAGEPKRIGAPSLTPFSCLFILWMAQC